MSKEIKKIQDAEYVEVEETEGADQVVDKKTKVVNGVKKYGKKIGKGILIGGGILLAYALGTKSGGKKKASDDSYQADAYIDVPYSEPETEAESEAENFDA